jgi:hypothetical protein
MAAASALTNSTRWEPSAAARRARVAATVVAPWPPLGAITDTVVVTGCLRAPRSDPTATGSGLSG